MLSIHAPTRGATSDQLKAMDGLDFQSTLLQEERPRFMVHLPYLLVFQSTLLQEERLKAVHIVDKKEILSIHAPTRGATDDTISIQECIKLSIHAPTRGATFKSTNRYDNQNLSIHAPTRGATFLFVFYTLLCAFNPRSYKRSDPHVLIFFCSGTHFQSTLLQEERLRFSYILRRLLQLSIHAPTRGAT